MRTEVLSSADPNWPDALAPIPGADVYHTASYHRVAEANGEGRGLTFVARSRDAVLFHPFLLRPIDRVGDEIVDGGWCDLETIYGYAGPLATTRDEQFLTRAWREFGDWCAGARVVAEFVRFHPLLGNERLADSETRIVEDRKTVVVDLPDDPELLWKAYPSVQRNMVRKAQNAGLEARIVPAAGALAEFRSLYDETMRRVGASSYYGFGDGYFDALAAQLGDRLRVAEVRDAGDLVAACLLLVGSDCLHYHLSGSLRRVASLGAMNLMLHEAATVACVEGLRAFHLGGGRTPAPDDSLLRFKRSLSHRLAPFYTGRRIHDGVAYQDLCETWLRQTGSERPPYFLLYRLSL